MSGGLPAVAAAVAGQKRPRDTDADGGWTKDGRRAHAVPAAPPVDTSDEELTEPEDESDDVGGGVGDGEDSENDDDEDDGEEDDSKRNAEEPPREAGADKREKSGSASKLKLGKRRKGAAQESDGEEDGVTEVPDGVAAVECMWESCGQKFIALNALIDHLHNRECASCA